MLLLLSSAAPEGAPVEATATTAVGTFVAQSAYASSGLEIRATSGVAEASISGGDLRATGAAAEVAQSGGSVRATGAAAEVAQSGGNVRATGTTAEALQSGGSLRASAIVVEVLTEWPPVVEVEVSTATATFTAGTAAAEAVVQVTTDAVTAVGTLVAGTPTTTSTVPIVTTASTAILTAVVPSVSASRLVPGGVGGFMIWNGQILIRNGQVAVDPRCCCGAEECCDCARLETIWDTGDDTTYLLATFTGIITGSVKLWRRAANETCCVRFTSGTFTINEQVDPPPNNPTMSCLSGNAIEASIELCCPWLPAYPPNAPYLIFSISQLADLGCSLSGQGTQKEYDSINCTNPFSGVWSYTMEDHPTTGPCPCVPGTVTITLTEP